MFAVSSVKLGLLFLFCVDYFCSVVDLFQINASLVFFLFSFQVHEKSILIAVV